MKTKIFLVVSALLMFNLSSCNKESILIEQASIDLADDDAVSDAIYEDVFNTIDNATIILDQMGKGGDSKTGTVVTDSCPTLTISRPLSALWPKKVTIDYGMNCIGLNNNIRSGKILIEVTGPREQIGSKRTVTFSNYFFNGIKVEGTKVFENIRLVSNLNPVISVILTGGKLTLPDGKVIERSFSHKREWIAGFTTKTIWDDECLITGTATGKNINGVVYKNTILTALHWTRACAFIVSGVVKIERGVKTMEMDYGSGTCDAKAVVSSGGESKEITLKHKVRTMGQ